MAGFFSRHDDSDLGNVLQVKEGSPRDLFKNRGEMICPGLR